MCKVPSGSWGYVRDDTHSVGWETGAITPLSTMSLRGALNLFSVLYGYLLLDVLDREDGRVSPDGIHPGHFSYGIKRGRRRLPSRQQCPGLQE